MRQLHELLEKRNPDLATQKWWAESVSEKQQAKLGVISKLADLLRHSPYAGLQAITPERLSSVAANDPAFSAFDETDLFTAATGAGLSVVDPVDIPPNPGVANYSALVEKLAEATDPTFVHAVFFNQPPASFAILGAGEGGRPFLLKAGGLRLDGATVIAAHAASGKGHGIEATARGKVLLPLKTAAAAGVDLHDLVVYHLADAARHRCRGGLLQAAYQHLVDVGLSAPDAARIILSLDLATEARPLVSADTIRALLAEGSLVAAEEALKQLTATVGDDHDRQKDAVALRTALDGQRARAEQLRLTAASAIRTSDIPAARTALLDAVRLDRDNVELTRDLDSLPPESPNHVFAAAAPVQNPADTHVTVSWQPGMGSDDNTRYRVVRKAGAAPRSCTDGTLIGETADFSLVDERPELIEEVHYAVFATRGKTYSLPTSATVTVVPGVGKFALTTTPTGVSGHWANPAQASEITVVQIGPDGTRTTVPLSSASSFLSDGLTQGARYRFEVTARYRTRSGVVISSESVVQEAIPRTDAQPVPSLAVKPLVTQDSVCRIEAQWSRQPAHEVQLWCFPQPPGWGYGSRVRLSELSGKGTQLHGQGIDKGRASTLIAEVPSGLLHYLAVTVDGDEYVIGQADELGICEPVNNPKVERFGDEAVLSWDWPAIDYSVRAVWSGPSTSGESTISKSRYDTSGGMRIRVGSGRSEIRLSTFINHADGQWQSPTRTLVVESASTSVKYQLSWNKKLFGGASGFNVTVQSDGDLNGAEFVIGYRADRVMPSSLRQIQEIQRHPLNLQAGESMNYTVNLPKMPKHYWVRCFLDAAEGTRIVDPLTDELRGR